MGVGEIKRRCAGEWCRRTDLKICPYEVDPMPTLLIGEPQAPSGERDQEARYSVTVTSPRMSEWISQK